MGIRVEVSDDNWGNADIARQYDFENAKGRRA
jgi:hypothetical protein